MALGIEQAEACEGVIEKRAHGRVEARGARLSCELLFAQALMERLFGGLSLFGRELNAIELDASAPVAIASWCAIESSKEDGCDEQRELSREHARIAGVDND